ncbi:S41 family peptidase [Solirubrobacter soli]|uniref:S41 family peptidase n=1 Tax=Solirubrobacter soli TaxID=363832 RepID=UPI00041332FE|nr:S41 family peptidase [Solirubrobacter soli]
MPEPKIVELDQFLAEATPLTGTERGVVVGQALRLFEDYYVHLALKRSMYGVDPVQRLRVLEASLDDFADDDQAFHEELLAIFRSVRDLHTVYKLPSHFHQRAAVLPFSVEEYFDDAGAHVVVKYVEREWERLTIERSGAPLARGVVITTWNGLPVRRAIENNADRQSGCNPAARHARGVATMTDRPLAVSPAPQEATVRVEFSDESGTPGTVTCKWRVIPYDTLEATDPDRVKGLGVDAVGEEVRRSSKQRFFPELVADEPGRRRAGLGASGRIEEPELEPPFLSRKPFADALQWRTIDVDGRPVGHLRIRSFAVLDPEAFVNEVCDILTGLPADGLILDVRGNGGGAIAAGELLLQVFTVRKITPEPMQVRTTPATRRLSSSSTEISAFRPSLTRAIETAEVYSDQQPLEPAHAFACNIRGQRYHGPVVLLVDALCYSTTDIFAAGFQDHGIGKVIGLDANTGAGGANVWNHGRLLGVGGGDSGLRALPGGTDMRVALRRTLRVNRSAGVPVEEFGITPDERHDRTRADVLDGNRDLLAFAVSILHHHSRPPCRLDVLAEPVDGGAKRLTITTERLTRIDAYVDGHPVSASIVVDPAGATTKLDVTGDFGAKLEILGFDEGGGPVAEAGGPIARFLAKSKTPK